jgi:hypothetical protein
LGLRPRNSQERNTVHKWDFLCSAECPAEPLRRQARKQATCTLPYPPELRHTPCKYLIRSGSLVFVSVLLGVQLGAAILVRHSVGVIVYGRFVRVGRLMVGRLRVGRFRVGRLRVGRLGVP